MALRTRRGLLATLGSLAVATAGCSERLPDALAGGRDGPEGWPTYGYDAGNTGAPPHDGPTADVEERWRFETDVAVESDPAVVGDTAFVGTADGRLYGVDTETGRADGSVRLEQSAERDEGVPVWHVAVADGRAYAGSDGLYAIDVETGEREWYVRGTPEGFPAVVQTCPAVVGGTVYVAGVGLYAIEGETGEEQWYFGTDGLPGSPDESGFPWDGLVFGNPAADDDGVYVATYGGTVYAVDAEGGEKRWQFDTERTIQGSPAVANGTVYVTTSGGVCAVDANTGEERWRLDRDSRLTYNGPAVSGDTVFVSRGTLTAIDADTGDVRWHLEPDGLRRYSRRCSPAVAEDTVYVGGFDSVTYAVTADDGEGRWQFDFDLGAAGGVGDPAVVDGVVYTVAGGRLYALGEP